VLNFYQIDGDGEIRTRDHLVIKVLIPCQRTISTQKLKLLGEVLGYDLYYSLTKIIKNTVKTFINHLLILKHPKIIQKYKNKLDLKKLNLMELFINLLFILQDESQKPS
jgi:hypothetical protein